MELTQTRPSSLSHLSISHFLISYFSISLLLLLPLSSRAAASADSSAGGTEYMQLVQWADEAVAKSDWERAIACLQEAMRTEPANPQNVMLMSNTGMIQHYAGNDSLALHTLTEARAIAPSSVVILKNRATVLTSLGRPDDAMRDYDMIIQMDSTYADAYQDRAVLLMNLDRYTEAEADIERYRRLRPKDTHGALMLAVIYSNTGRAAEAVPLYTELLKSKEEAVYYSARAMCRMVSGDLFSAADDIARGLELEPDDAELYFCRAYLNHLRFRDSDRDSDAAKAAALGIDRARIKALPSLPR